MTECTHHWLISSPNGPTSHGECKHCGITKDFSNGEVTATWGSTIHSRYNYFGARKRKQLEAVEEEERCND